MAARDLTLRRAEARDENLLLGWANDEDTRAGSFTTERIEPQAHRKWMARSLDGARHLLVAELEGEPVGLVRLEPVTGETATAEVGITLAPSARGHGLAVPLLAAGCTAAAELGIAKLVARVRADNTRSVRAFARAGYRLEAEQRVRGVRALRYVRSTRHD